MRVSRAAERFIEMFGTVIIWALFLAILLGGCDSDTREAEPARDFKIVRLFDHAGCTVFRFEDKWVDHYWAVCDRDRSASVSSTRRHSCTDTGCQLHSEQISTDGGAK